MISKAYSKDLLRISTSQRDIKSIQTMPSSLVADSQMNACTNNYLVELHLSISGFGILWHCS